MDIWSWLCWFVGLYLGMALITAIWQFLWLTAPIRSLSRLGCTPPYPISLYVWAALMALFVSAAWPVVLPRMIARILRYWWLLRGQAREQREATAALLARMAPEVPPGQLVRVDRPADPGMSCGARPSIPDAPEA